MKNAFVLSIIILTGIMSLHAQGNTNTDTGKIKLFVDEQRIIEENKEISPDLATRIYYKTIQAINQTGVAEIGYSNFFVTPKLFIIDTTVSEAGMDRLCLAKCDLTYTVSRRDYGNSGSVSYNSYTRHLIGSGKTAAAAINEAVNKISVTDKGILDFLSQTKIKIRDYFNRHCNEVLQEAQQSVKLGAYDKAIALYFSVPDSAPCYREALDKSIATYARYQNQVCTRNLTLIKSLVAGVIRNDGNSSAMYQKVIEIINQLDATDDACFVEVQKEIATIQGRFDVMQKREWDLKLKTMTDAAELEKEAFKNMRKVAESYSPPGSTPVIINNR